MLTMNSMELQNNQGGLNMEEKVYRSMKSVGVGNLVLGILIIVFGVAAGIAAIVNGARMLTRRKDLMF